MRTALRQEAEALIIRLFHLVRYLAARSVVELAAATAYYSFTNPLNYGFCYCNRSNATSTKLVKQYIVKCKSFLIKTVPHIDFNKVLYSYRNELPNAYVEITKDRLR